MQNKLIKIAKLTTIKKIDIFRYLPIFIIA